VASLRCLELDRLFEYVQATGWRPLAGLGRGLVAVTRSSLMEGELPCSSLTAECQLDKNARPRPPRLLISPCC
jgi:hypothetical protein